MCPKRRPAPGHEGYASIKSLAFARTVGAIPL